MTHAGTVTLITGPLTISVIVQIPVTAIPIGPISNHNPFVSIAFAVKVKPLFKISFAI